MLGHSMDTLHLYKLLREVQKHLGGLGYAPLENFTASQVGSEAISYCSVHHCKLAYGEHMRLVI